MKLICYLSNGFPTIADSIELAETYVAAGCDVIEIDFPGRNPYLESDYLADRMQRALEACGDYGKYMEGMAEAKRRLPNTQFILLMYEDTLEEIGFARFTAFCRDNGFRDLIFVGFKDGANKDRLIKAGIRVSCYVQYHMPAQELEHAKRSNGFVYLQAKPTNGNVNPAYPTLRDCVAHLREQGITSPIYCGVGVHAPADAAMAKSAGADGIFVGSAVLKLQEDPEAMTAMIKAFKANR